MPTHQTPHDTLHRRRDNTTDTDNTLLHHTMLADARCPFLFLYHPHVRARAVRVSFLSLCIFFVSQEHGAVRTGNLIKPQNGGLSGSELSKVARRCGLTQPASWLRLHTSSARGACGLLRASSVVVSSVHSRPDRHPTTSSLCHGGEGAYRSRGGGSGIQAHSGGSEQGGERGLMNGVPVRGTPASCSLARVVFSGRGVGSA